MKEEIIYEPVSTGNNVAQVGKQIERFANKNAGYLILFSLTLCTVAVFQIELAYYQKMFDSFAFAITITMFMNVVVLTGMLLNINNIRYKNTYGIVAGLTVTMGVTLNNIYAADLMAEIFNPSKAEHYCTIIRFLNGGRAVIELFLITTVIGNKNV